MIKHCYNYVNTWTLAAVMTSALIPFQASHSAVHLSSTETGSAIIVPFYTVSNQMNTLLSLNNTTDDNKAVKIHFKEAKSGDILTSFNVYLTGQDMWTMGMGQVPSIDGGRLRMISNDQSCTAGFPNNQDIDIDDDWLWENGTIEIIEMAVLDHIEAPFSYRHCNYINDSWLPNENIMSPASGGLHAEVTLMDVEEGHSANIPVIHLDGFYGEDNIQFTAAGDDSPNLSSGTKDSLVMANGQALTTTWPTGYEAVSALLMHNSITNEYNTEPLVAAQTEWIISFPTLFYHLANDNSKLPFKTSGVEAPNFWFPNFFSDAIRIFTREAVENYSGCNVGLCPPTPVDTLSHSVENLAVQRDDVTEQPPLILTSESQSNSRHFPFIFYAWDETIHFDSGKIKINLNTESNYSLANNRGHDSTNFEINHTYHGLPVVGFVYTQFSNANAQPGLLAQYAFLREHFGEKKVVIGNQQ